MEIANILDIDGTQWEIQDAEARNKITVIEDFLTAKEMPDISITLNNGYSVSTKLIRHVQKYGKLYTGLLFIDDLEGNYIGTNNIAAFGKVNISLNQRVDAIGIEYLNSKPVRLSIEKNGDINMQESAGITPGKNRIRIPITWLEA